EAEEVLSEVETKNYPSEVRDWLTMTFTRSLSNVRKAEDRLHFRGVATAIRAGIVVDRLIYRRMSSSVGIHVPPNVLLQMKDLDDWNFDVFKVNEIGEGHALKYVGYELFQKHDLINKFKISTSALDNFLGKLEQGYSKYNNPYHNLVHGADVTQTTHFVISSTDFILWLSDLDVFAVLVSALIHDYEHTGTTNAFQVNTKSELAYLYNDRNVLENHHVSATFRLMKEETNNILMSLTKEEFKEFRALVIEIVLATDMSFHFQQLKNMKNLLTTPENIDKPKALSLLVHCADISHPGKNWRLHEKWTNLLVEEFFRQGDREAELDLPISPLCDRKNTIVAESQIGFIDFIVDPSFQVLGDMLDKIVIPLKEQKQEYASDESKISTNVPSISSPWSSSSCAKFNEDIGWFCFSYLAIKL
ncbi:hypothetical protein HELRODRAFT_68834, partial [Helobdella robusta]|uniref:3',5'-cyclic-nucleotide phosphodiesterase n=1 Tax=Helobdella robusta TaxID=6412 RepID=T1FZK3_HELRO